MINVTFTKLLLTNFKPSISTILSFSFLRIQNPDNDIEKEEISNYQIVLLSKI